MTQFDKMGAMMTHALTFVEDDDYRKNLNAQKVLQFAVI